MQVTEKISDWSGYPEQQVRFVFMLYFRDSLRFVHNVSCFRPGIKVRNFFRQAFSTRKYSGFSCQDWNSWSGSIPFLPIQMCLSVHCISYARVFQLPIYDGRPLSRMSWIIFFVHQDKPLVALYSAFGVFFECTFFSEVGSGRFVRFLRCRRRLEPLCQSMIERCRTYHFRNHTGN